MTAIEIINQIEADKIRLHIAPVHALKLEVIKKAQAIHGTFAKAIIEAELTELVRTGKIKIGDTLNDKYIKVL